MWGGRILRKNFALITARIIGLPNFEYGVRYNISVSVEDLAANSDSLPGDVLRREVVALQVNHAQMKERADGLRCCRSRGHLDFPNAAETLTAMPPREWLGGRGGQNQNDIQARGQEWWCPSQNGISGDYARSR